jgi:hypothetical protein
MKQYCRNIFYELKWIAEEIIILIKHPTRKASRNDISYHWYKLWDNIIFHPWYCLTRGIKNIYIWGALIWKLDYWDHFYLEDMIDKQLEEMEKLWEKQYAPRDREYFDTMDKGYRCQHIRIWKRIRWTRKLMRMYRDEHYSMLAYDEHRKAFPNRDILKSTPHTVDEYGIVTSYICDPMTEDESKHFRNTSGPARLKDEKCFKLFIKNFSNLRNWWD